MRSGSRAQARLASALLLATALAASCSPPAAGPVRRQPAISLPAATATVPATPAPAIEPTMTFAVIGDFGSGDSHERAVADLVASWDPAFIITTGDDYYSSAGGSGTGRYARSVGAFYGRWLAEAPRAGSDASEAGTATRNAFFPSLGNHDYSDARPSLESYLTYFTLPGAGFANTSGNERYYDFVEGPVHFFVLNSNTMEPDGTSAGSKQARWLRAGLAASTSAFNVVYDHHPPYSSDSVHGSSAYMRWPFASWGADVVISGHAHTYERVMRDGIPYFVNGLGGAARYGLHAAVAGSAVRYDADWGAQKVTVTDSSMTFEFITVSGTRRDDLAVPAEGASP